MFPHLAKYYQHIHKPLWMKQISKNPLPSSVSIGKRIEVFGLKKKSPLWIPLSEVSKRHIGEFKLSHIRMFEERDRPLTTFLPWIQHHLHCPNGSMMGFAKRYELMYCIGIAHKYNLSLFDQINCYTLWEQMNEEPFPNFNHLDEEDEMMKHYMAFTFVTEKYVNKEDEIDKIWQSHYSTVEG